MLQRSKQTPRFNQQHSAYPEGICIENRPLLICTSPKIELFHKSHKVYIQIFTKFLPHPPRQTLQCGDLVEVTKHGEGMEMQLWLQSQLLLLLERQLILSILLKFWGEIWIFCMPGQWYTHHLCAPSPKQALQELCSQEVLAAAAADNRDSKHPFPLPKCTEAESGFAICFWRSAVKEKKSEQELLIFVFSFWQQTT